MPSLANPFTLQKQFLFTSAFTCLVLCATLAVILSSFWAFAPLFIAALFYSILRWPVQLIAAILFLVPFLPLPLQGLKALGFSWGESASAVKELGLLAAGCVLAFRHGLKLEKSDLVLLGLFVWALVVTLIHPTSSAPSGLKDDFDFVIPYIVGRLISLRPGWIKTGLWVAGFVAILGLIEFFFAGIGTRMLLMGVQDIAELTPTFKADFFEGFRAGSTLGGPLEFGGFCAVALLVFGSFYRDLPKKYLVFALLIASGLIVSLTRMAGLALLLGLLFIAIRTGQKLRLATITLGLTALTLGVLLPRMGLQEFFKASLSGEDSSLGSHRTSLEEKSVYVLSHPIGTGAGTVGPRALVRDPNALQAESAFLQFGLEYGWLGILLFTGFCGWICFRLRKVGSNFGIAACAVAIAMFTMYFFSAIHMEFGLCSWAWVTIGFGIQQRGHSLA